MKLANKNIHAFIRIALFGAIVCAIVFCTSAVFTPYYKEKDGVRGFYEQPRNSVQTLFLGASTVLCGVSPNSLYENHGISSYNLATSAQPYITSYYLLKDAIRLQGKSLEAVVIDATPLVNDDEEDERSPWAMKAYSYMDWSLVKLEYLRALTEQFPDINFLEELIPALRFHSRWSELEQKDFSEYLIDSYQTFSHGQLLDRRALTSNITKNKAGKYTRKKNNTITADQDLSEDECRALWDPQNLTYLKKITDLCKQENLTLILLKTPNSQWGDSEHDSVSYYAEQHNIPFLDMAINEIWEQTNLDYDADYRDGKHVNILGSLKLTAYLGNYLANNYPETDAESRTNGFTETDLENYHAVISDAELARCNTLAEYLELIKNERYVTFVAAQNLNATEMQNTQESLASIRLTKLATLQSQESYIAVINGEICAVEQRISAPSSTTITGYLTKQGATILDANNTRAALFSIPFQLQTSNDTKSLASRITIDEEALCPKKQGLCFVVYCPATDMIIDIRAFESGSQ